MPMRMNIATRFKVPSMVARSARRGRAVHSSAGGGGAPASALAELGAGGRTPAPDALAELGAGGGTPAPDALAAALAELGAQKVLPRR